MKLNPKVLSVDFERSPCSDFLQVTAPYEVSYYYYYYYYYYIMC